MNKNVFCIFALLFCIKNLYADIPFTVEIHNVTVNGGLVYIRVFSNEASFRGRNPIPEQTITIEPNSTILTVEIQIPIGYHVIGIHQDTNGNGDMDYNFLRIPLEPYGFSNMRGRIPGNFNQMKFRVNNINEKIVIPFIMY
jgi:uncharacterized protein (DUF2141 family)